MKMMIGFDARLLEATFAITFVIGSVASAMESCFNDTCLVIPETDVKLDFDGAKSWCAKQSSQLAVVTDSTTQRMLTEFLSSSKLNQPAFINVRIYERQWQSTWFLLNGSMYNGGLLNQNDRHGRYAFYGSLSNNSDGMILSATNPTRLNNYVCQFRDSNQCSSDSRSDYVFNESCYIKFDDEALSWFQARETCYKKGADLATFNYPDRSYVYDYNPPFNTSWLNASSTYWIGIRWDKWMWKAPECGDEIIYTSWASGRPNNITLRCVCVDPYSSPAFSWIDCDCDIPRQFVCLKSVTLSTSPFPSSSPSMNPAPQRPADSVFIGLVVGTAMNLLLLIIILVLIIVIIRLKRRMRETTRSVIRSGDSAKTGRDEVISELETDLSDPRYASLDARNGTISKRIYETINY